MQNIHVKISLPKASAAISVVYFLWMAFVFEWLKQTCFPNEANTLLQSNVYLQLDQTVCYETWKFNLR